MDDERQKTAILQKMSDRAFGADDGEWDYDEVNREVYFYFTTPVALDTLDRMRMQLTAESVVVQADDDDAFTTKVTYSNVTFPWQF